MSFQKRDLNVRGMDDVIGGRLGFGTRKCGSKTINGVFVLDNKTLKPIAFSPDEAIATRIDGLYNEYGLDIEFLKSTENPEYVKFFQTKVGPSMLSQTIDIVEE